MFTLPWPSFRGSTVDDNVVIEDLYFNLFHPQGQRGVPILILGCNSERWESVRALCPRSGDRGAQDQCAAALEVERVAIKSQVVPIAGDDAGGISADMTVVKAVLLQAVLIILAGDILTIHAVVGAIAVAEEVAAITLLTSQPCPATC
uniref:Uncharacterized protein n=1 Tax=Falco tinnunculus TaxID=100819 RepID=A0A8C4UAH2_FALTI